jgi:protein-S-isoprenylcysteine O-methyltransferase Ste14
MIKALFHKVDRGIENWVNAPREAARNTTNERQRGKLLMQQSVREVFALVVVFVLGILAIVGIISLLVLNGYVFLFVIALAVLWFIRYIFKRPPVELRDNDINSNW